VVCVFLGGVMGGFENLLNGFHVYQGRRRCCFSALHMTLRIVPRSRLSLSAVAPQTQRTGLFRPCYTCVVQAIFPSVHRQR
jgi:hypothetical protein